MEYLFLKNVWIWTVFCSSLNVLLFDTEAASLWGCETGRANSRWNDYPQNCAFGDINKVGNAKHGNGRLLVYSSNHNYPQQDYRHGGGGGGYGRSSYRPRMRMGWNNYRPRQMSYRPMKRMYSYPVHKRGYQQQRWKPKHEHGYGAPKHWFPKKKEKKKKDINIQIVVHCPSEHPLCKTSYGKSHGYERHWKPKKRYSHERSYGKPHQGYGHSRGYGKHQGWERQSYDHQQRYQSYRPEKKWDEKKWEEKKWDEKKWEEHYDHDDDKYCDCREEPKHYDDDSGYSVQHQVFYERNDDEAVQHDPGNYVYNDYGTNSDREDSNSDIEELERDGEYLTEHKMMNGNEPQDTFVYVEATPPPLYRKKVNGIPQTQGAVSQLRVEKSLPPSSDDLPIGKELSQREHQSSEQLGLSKIEVPKEDDTLESTTNSAPTAEVDAEINEVKSTNSPGSLKMNENKKDEDEGQIRLSHEQKSRLHALLRMSSLKT